MNQATLSPAPATHAPAPAPVSQASLYQRLGGETGIRTFVTDILRLHHQNPVIMWAYSKAEKTDAQLIDLVVDLIGMGTGGPNIYKGMDMRAAHKGMWVTDEEFIAVLDDIRKAMEINDVDPQANAELMAIAYGMKAEIVRG